MKTDREAILAGNTGHDNLRNFDERCEVNAKLFGLLKPVIGEPKKIFVGGCGYGTDLMAIGRVFPEAQITAVSLGELPLGMVRRALGNRLTFYEMTMLEYFEKAQYGGRFDLMMFMFVQSHEFRQPEFYYGLYNLLEQGGFILTDDSGSFMIDGHEMFYMVYLKGFVYRVAHDSTIFFQLYREGD